MDARRLTGAAALFFCATCLAASAHAQSIKPAAEACEEAVNRTIGRVRGKDARQVQFISAKRVLTELSDNETFVKGEGRYRPNTGSPVGFAYSCAVDMRSGAASGVVFRETGAAGTSAASASAADVASLDPAACEAAAARALTEKNPRAERIVFNPDQRRLSAAGEARTGLQGEGALVRAPGMYAERFTYRCVFEASGRKLSAVETSD